MWKNAFVESNISSCEFLKVLSRDNIFAIKMQQDLEVWEYELE